MSRQKLVCLVRLFIGCLNYQRFSPSVFIAICYPWAAVELGHIPGRQKGSSMTLRYKTVHLIISRKMPQTRSLYNHLSHGYYQFTLSSGFCYVVIMTILQVGYSRLLDYRKLIDIYFHRFGDEL